jgi:hypothetical protein
MTSGFHGRESADVMTSGFHGREESSPEGE